MTYTLTTIDLFEERFGFSAAHFTLFSSTRRERLHGHNYQVRASIVAKVQELGIAFDYAVYKQKIFTLCQQLDSFLLLPGTSPVLQIQESDLYWQVFFDNETMSFLKKDVLILPIRNITMEELSLWFLNQITADHSTLHACDIHSFTIHVSNGPGRWGSASWQGN